MPDNSQVVYDWNLPKQDVAGADIRVKSGYQPSQEFDVESGAGSRFIEAQKKAIEDSKVKSAIQSKRINEYQANKNSQIDAITEQFAMPLLKGVPTDSKEFSDIIAKTRSQAEESFNDYEKSQQEQQDKHISSLPNHLFGFGKDKELYDKVHSFRADVAKNAEESLGAIPDWMKASATYKYLAPMSAGLAEGTKQLGYDIYNTAEELLDKPTMQYKQHFQEEARKMYPKADQSTIEREGKKFYENWVIEKAQKERPNDFKEQGLTHYIDKWGNPTLELKKDAYNISGGDPKKMTDAVKQLIDYERGNFNAAKSRNQENWEAMQQMLIDKGSGIPYIIQKTVGGVLGAVNAEVETAKGLSSVLEGGSYSEGVAAHKKHIAETMPTEMQVDLKNHPYIEAASSLGYGITNLLTRAMLAKATFGEGEVMPMQNFVNSLAKDAPNYGKASQFVYNALKNTPVSKFANITDKALDMSKIFFVPTLNDNIAKNRELGYSDKENYIKSTKDAIASMYIFSLIAHEPESAQKQFERLLNPEQRALFTNIKNTGKSMAVSGSAMAANKVYQDYADSKGDFDLGKSISGAGKEFVQGAMFDLGMKALNPQQLLSKSPQSDAVAYFLRDKEALKQQLDKGLESGQITPQQYIDIPKAFNSLQSHFHEGKGFELDDRAAAQYATEKAKYNLLDGIVKKMQASPTIDNKAFQDAQQRRDESARTIRQIRNGTYLKGRVISSKEMLDVAAKTKPETEKKAYTKDKKKLVIVSAPYVQEKMALEPLKADDNVRKNLAILTYKEALQHNIDLHNKTQEEIDFIENGHKEIKGVRNALPMSEKDVKRLDALKEVRSNINKSLEPLGGTDAVKDMLEYDDKANNGHIVIDKNGDVIDGKKQVATRLFNGDKEGSVVRALSDAERATLAKQPVADPIAEDLKVNSEPYTENLGFHEPLTESQPAPLQSEGDSQDIGLPREVERNTGTLALMESGFSLDEAKQFVQELKDGKHTPISISNKLQKVSQSTIQMVNKLTPEELANTLEQAIKVKENQAPEKVQTPLEKAQADHNATEDFIQTLKDRRDGEEIKYKNAKVTNPDGTISTKKVLKTPEELKASKDKINEAINKAQAELEQHKKTIDELGGKAVEQYLKETPKAETPTPKGNTSNVEGDVKSILNSDVDLKGDKKEKWMEELPKPKTKDELINEQGVEIKKTKDRHYSEIQEGVKSGDIEAKGNDYYVAKTPKGKEILSKVDNETKLIVPAAKSRIETARQWDLSKIAEHRHKISEATEGKFQKAIEEGRMTANDAVKIIESAGLEVPQDIAKQSLSKQESEASNVGGDVEIGNTFLFPNGEERIITDIKGDNVYSVPADKPNYNLKNIDSVSDIKELMSKKEEYVKQANQRNEQEKNKVLEEQKQKDYLDDIDDFGNDKAKMQKGKIKSILNNKPYGTKTTKDTIRDIMNKAPFIETLNGKEYICYKEDGEVYSLPEKYNNKTSIEYLQHLIDIGYEKEKTPNEPIKDNKVEGVLKANIRQNQTFAIVKIDGVEREVEIMGIDEKTGGFKIFDNENGSKSIIKREDIVDYDIEPKEEYNKDAIETIPVEQPLKETPKAETPKEKYEDIEKIKSEAVRNKRLNEFVEEHFESIVSQLVTENKIRKKCK